MLVSPQNGTSLQVGTIYRLPCTQMGSQSFRSGPCTTFLTIYFPLIPLIVSNLQYPRECQGELWIIVRGDGLPCGGESWCQMSISFANHGHLARTLSYHWTVNVALCGEKSTSVLSQVWANNLAFLQSALDSGVVPIRGASRRCRIFCVGDSPWLRRLSGVTTHWMAGSLFSYMTWCKSSATWLQKDVDRTTEQGSDHKSR